MTTTPTDTRTGPAWAGWALAIGATLVAAVLLSLVRFPIGYILAVVTLGVLVALAMGAASRRAGRRIIAGVVGLAVIGVMLPLPVAVTSLRTTTPDIVDPTGETRTRLPIGMVLWEGVIVERQSSARIADTLEPVDVLLPGWVRIAPITVDGASVMLSMGPETGEVQFRGATADGQEVFRTDPLPGIERDEAPAVLAYHDGVLVVGALAGEDRQTVVALDLASGKPLWQQTVVHTGPVLGLRDPIGGVPMIPSILPVQLEGEFGGGVPGGPVPGYGDGVWHILDIATGEPGATIDDPVVMAVAGAEDTVIGIRDNFEKSIVVTRYDGGKKVWSVTGKYRSPWWDDMSGAALDDDGAVVVGTEEYSPFSGVLFLRMVDPEGTEMLPGDPARFGTTGIKVDKESLFGRDLVGVDAGGREMWRQSAESPTRVSGAYWSRYTRGTSVNPYHADPMPEWVIHERETGREVRRIVNVPDIQVLSDGSVMGVVDQKLVRFRVR